MQETAIDRIVDRVNGGERVDCTWLHPRHARRECPLSGASASSTFFISEVRDSYQ
jgi:hypothetical protein